MFENIHFLQTPATIFSIFVSIKVAFYFNYISLFISEIKDTNMSFVLFMLLTHVFLYLICIHVGYGLWTIEEQWLTKQTRLLYLPTEIGYWFLFRLIYKGSYVFRKFILCLSYAIIWRYGIFKAESDTFSECNKVLIFRRSTGGFSRMEAAINDFPDSPVRIRC